ncbi:unnamed protein product [Adineta steineri]|uniref:Uncharacterized protein n=1 Tax=Adineta steineri TaxID=433720 RepID=A0A819H7A8_9BILA|nr:unnamed protein product [Adineta steineri]CAF0908410.1 unnamed protein product [Adineta steineri]CAF3892971.1 unnamed protein product [Adineta steineri]CAF3940496.1 unnamed protein product [Adineta steineri]
MADDQEQGASNEEGGPDDYNNDPVEEDQSIIETTTATIQEAPTAAIYEEVETLTTTITTNVGEEDYVDDEGPLPDFTVDLFINDAAGDVSIPTDLAQAGLTDIYGNPLASSTPFADYVAEQTASITNSIYDELSSSATEVSGKGWWGHWPWSKILIIGLIALCIIGIILALVFCLLGKKFRKNQRTPPPAKPGSSGTAKHAVTQGIGQGTKYESVAAGV